MVSNPIRVEITNFERERINLTYIMDEEPPVFIDSFISLEKRYICLPRDVEYLRNITFQ